MVALTIRSEAPMRHLASEVTAVGSEAEYVWHCLAVGVRAVPRVLVCDSAALNEVGSTECLKLKVFKADEEHGESVRGVNVQRPEEIGVNGPGRVMSTRGSVDILGSV